MTTVGLYRLYLWFPLALSATALLAFWTGWTPEFVPLGVAAGTLAVSGIFGGVPYLLLVLWAVRWLRGKDEHSIRHMALRMPLLMIPVYGACALVYGIIAEGSTVNALALVAIGAVYSIPLGYTYVGLGFLIHRLLKVSGCVSPAHAA